MPAGLCVGEGRAVQDMLPASPPSLFRHVGSCGVSWLLGNSWPSLGQDAATRKRAPPEASFSFSPFVTRKQVRVPQPVGMHLCVHVLCMFVYVCMYVCMYV